MSKRSCSSEGAKGMLTVPGSLRAAYAHQGFAYARSLLPPWFWTWLNGSIGMYPQYILVMSRIGCKGSQCRAQGRVISIGKFLSSCSYSTWVCSKMGSTAQTTMFLGNVILGYPILRQTQQWDLSWRSTCAMVKT